MNLDILATWWLGRRHGYPVSAGREYFYEPDESIAKIQRAWEEGVKGFTERPAVGIRIADFDLSTNVIRDNRILRP